MIAIEVRGAREVAARLAAAGPAVHRGVVRATGKLGYQLEGRAKDLVSGPMLQVRTGVGRSSINTAIADQGEGQGATATVGIGRQAPYMAIQHEGVDHSWIISAIRAKAMRFKIGGQTIFRRSVTHPPLKPHPFLTQPLREEIMPIAAATYEAEIAAELAK